MTPIGSLLKSGSGQRSACLGLSTFLPFLLRQAPKEKERKKKEPKCDFDDPSNVFALFSGLNGVPRDPSRGTFPHFLVLNGWHRSGFCSKVAQVKDGRGSGCQVFFIFCSFGCPRLEDKGKNSESVISMTPPLFSHGFLVSTRFPGTLPEVRFLTFWS